jgi:tuberous sclerosis protein 2
MAEWMPAVMEDAKVESRKLFVTILVNLVHFNAVYLETHHVQQLVQTCGRYLAANTDTEIIEANTDTEIIELILDFLNSLVCFGCLSAGVLEHFVLSLCWILNCERFCTRSWDVMRKLLGTHLGHNTLVTLQAIVTERKGNPSEVLVVRAAIFYISMALWGPNRISKLGSCFSPFLPTLMEGVLTYQTIVVYEVSLSLLRLTKKHGTDLGPGEWEEIVNILAVIDKHVRREVGSQVGSTLKNTVDEIFNVIEMLHENGCLIGVDSKFYLLVEQSSQFRTINSIVSLIRFKSKGLSPDEPQWISSFNQLLTTFYSGERRTEVRLQVLEVLKRKLEKYLVFYEDMLLHDVVVPTLNSVSSDPDPSVRKVAVEIMVQVAENCSPSWCHHLINCIYQVCTCVLLACLCASTLFVCF